MKLTGAEHGDAANDLVACYHDMALGLEQGGQYYIAAVVLGLAVESALLAYILVEFGEDNGGEIEVPDSVGLADLIEAANSIDVLTAPIGIKSHTGTGRKPSHRAKEAVEKIRKFRNYIHPARMLKEGFNPSAFTQKDLADLKDLYDSVLHSLLYHL